MNNGERDPKQTVGLHEFWNAYENGKWEPNTKKILERFLQPDGWLLDIGAWIGPVTMWANSLGAHSFCLEPDPVAFQTLVHNTLQPGPINAYLNYALVAGPTAPRTIEIEANGGWGSSMTRLAFGQAFESRLAVGAIAPEALLHLVPELPDLIKVDIEGGERFIAEPLARLASDQGIPLLISWHEPWWPEPADVSLVRSWFSGYDCLEGGFGGWDTLLATWG